MNATPSQPAGVWRLIITVAIVIAVIAVVAVLAFQIMEYFFYGQPPSVWPTP